MTRTVALLLAAVSLMACDPFKKAERRINNPNGKVNNEAGVQQSVQKGSQQSNSSNIIDLTSDTLVLPFEALVPRTGLDELLARPEIDIPHKKMVGNLILLARAHSAEPYAFQTVDAGTIDVTAATGGECSGSIDFSLEVDLDGLGLSGTVRSLMSFKQVACPDGSVDGEVGLQVEFDTLALSIKVVNIVTATVSDTVETSEVDFGLLFEAGLTETSFDVVLAMSVAVDDDFYTLKIDAGGTLEAGEATLTIEGKDGSVSCTATAGLCSCTGFAEFEI
jgi:hypothetical protein